MMKFVSKSIKKAGVIFKGLGNGLHQVTVFPLLYATNLVGRRAAFTDKIRVSNLGYGIANVGKSKINDIKSNF